MSVTVFPAHMFSNALGKVSGRRSCSKSEPVTELTSEAWAALDEFVAVLAAGK